MVMVILITGTDHITVTVLTGVIMTHGTIHIMVMAMDTDTATRAIGAAHTGLVITTVTGMDIMAEAVTIHIPILILAMEAIMVHAAVAQDHLTALTGVAT